MKRKRRSVKPKPKKNPKAAGNSVDPGYYSDVNEENDENGSTTGIKEKEVNTTASSQQLGLDKPEGNNRTVGSGAAKLARARSSSHTNAVNDIMPPLRERTGVKELKSSLQDLLYNKQELDAAHSVIKKIMKMDGAAPFNAPVDPIALGIPDYFDIVDTPMDFGTINSNLEKGLQYKNSKDVFKDVQQIWDNCTKYNKKGTYVLYLMKLVKANFMKHWIAAGLHKEQQSAGNGHLPHSPPVIDSTTRDEDAPDVYPGASAINNSAYMQPHDSHFMNQRQHPPLSPCWPPSFNHQHMPYQWPGSHHPGQPHPGHHNHGMPPPCNYYTHHHSDHMNGNSCCNPSPSLMHSYHLSPGCSHMGHPHHGTWVHPPSSSHVALSGLHSGINDRTAGHLHAPHRDSIPILNKHDHAFNSAGGHHHQHHPVDSVRTHAHHPSTSCIPGQQLNVSTHHQFQNPSTEVGRYTDHAGDLHSPPLTESVVNFTKRGTDSPQSPVNDDSSFEPATEINSTPEQSSSMGIEACHETRADNDISKSKTQAQGVVERQELLSPAINSYESVPKDNTCQTQTISPQRRPSLPYNKSKPKNHRVRGPAKEILLGEEEHIRITLNEEGQPIGPEAQKLASYLGSLARNGNFLPLPYSDWRYMPAENKENMWQKVQSKFEIDPAGKHWVIRTLAKRWKDWKSKLKIAHFDTHETNEERLADIDDRIIPEQWPALVAFWNTEKAQINSARNRANCMKKKYNHTTGRKSFAQMREEEREKRPEGKELSRAELFVLTRTRKNGEPINAEVSKVIMQLRERENGEDTPQEGNKSGDSLTEVIGLDKIGRPRCAKLGPAPDNMQKSTRTEAIKMVSEAKTEIKEMKDKISAVEQACSQMASQMAAMMSMVASLKKNESEKITPIIDRNASDASDHSSPSLEPTRPSPSVGSTRKTRQGNKRSH